MKKDLLITFMSCLMAWFSGLDSSGQFAGEPGNIPNEELALYTDRNLYAAGEEILFRTFNLSPPSLKNSGWSKVLYLELLDARNNAVARGKYRHFNRGATGALDIPGTAVTGNYTLRAYTRWMRNFHASDYAMVSLTIINPHNDIIQGESANQALPDTLPDTLLAEENLVCSSDEAVYEKRSKATIRISLPPGQGTSGEEEYCVSVVPAGAVRAGRLKGSDPPRSAGKKTGEIVYDPETRGISISGRVIENTGDTPLAFAPVHLSILGSQPDYAGFITDELGEFHILLPDRTGLQNLFVAAEPAEGRHARILIDNDFSSDLSGLTPEPFSLTEQEKALAREIAFAAQLDKAYEMVEKKDSGALNNGYDHRPFYGTPNITIKIEDYVPLPTLEEFIVELIPEINIRKRKDKISMVLTGTHTDLSVYPPLILYDLVPVFDLDAFLKLSYENIKRIEVINATYQRGDLTFGGIVSVFSPGHDLAGFDFKGASNFFDFRAYQQTEERVFPDYSTGSSDRHIPDFRNTLYWDPQVTGNPGETLTLEFYTSDRSGEYTVLVRGISSSGNLLQDRTGFTVK